ncbi:MAG: hypothetical protein U9P79_08535, partial [Candidatus Cloacimonadota bacterium]|nr:hypothetical protein [Candidatus Cloacimonadota bacterium]
MNNKISNDNTGLFFKNATDPVICKIIFKKDIISYICWSGILNIFHEFLCCSLLQITTWDKMSA